MCSVTIRRGDRPRNPPDRYDPAVYQRPPVRRPTALPQLVRRPAAAPPPPRQHPARPAPQPPPFNMAEEQVDVAALMGALTAQIGRLQLGAGAQWPRLKDDENFSKFVERLNVFSNAHQFNQVDAERMLPLLLHDRALEVYKSIKAAEPNIAWDVLLTRLKERLHTNQRCTAARIKLADLVCGDDVAKFAKSVDELAEASYPFNPETSRAIALERFTSGLPSELRLAVYRASPATFAEAKELAIKEKACLEMARKPELRAEITSLQHSVASLQHAASHRGRGRGRGSGHQKRGRQSGRGSYYNTRRESSRDDRDYRSDQSQQQHSDRHRSSSNRRNYDTSNSRKQLGPRRDQRSQSRDRQQSSYRVNTITTPIFTPMLIIALVVALAPVSSAIKPAEKTQYFSCQQPRGGVLVAVPKLESCETPNAEEVQELEVALYYRNATIQETAAVRCSVERYRQCDYFVFFRTSTNLTLEDIVSPTIEECQNAVVERDFRGRPLRPTEIFGVYRSEIDPGKDLPAAKVFGESCTNIERMVIEKGVVGTIEQKIFTNLLLNTDGCRMSDGHCSNNISTIIWTPRTSNDCHFVLLGVFSGLLSDDIVTVEERQAAFVVKERISPHDQRCFEFTSWETTSGALIGFPGSPGAQTLEAVRSAGSLLKETTRSASTMLTTENPTSTTTSEARRRRIPNDDYHPSMAIEPSTTTDNNIPSEVSISSVSASFDKSQMSKTTSSTPMEGQTSVSTTSTTNEHIYVLPTMDLPEEVTTTSSWIEHKITRHPLRPRRTAGRHLQPHAGERGTSADVQFMQAEFDFHEERRRNLTAAGINSRVEFASEKLRKAMQTNFKRIFDAACHLHNRQLQIWSAMLSMDATTGIRTMLQRNDLTARLVGKGILLVSQCTSITIAEVFPNNSINESCYATMPVLTTDNTTMFVQPGTFDLSVIGERIPCAEVVPSAFEKDGTFYFGDDDDVNITTLHLQPPGSPVPMSPIRFEGHDVFEKVKGSSFPLRLAITYGETMAQMRTNQQLIMKVLDRAYPKKGNILDIARFGGYQIDDFTGKIKGIVEGWTDFYKTYLLWIGLPVGSIILMGILIYLSVKCYCLRKMQATPIFSLQTQSTETDVEEIAMKTTTESRQSRIPPFDIQQRRNLLPPMMTFVPIVIQLVCAVGLAQTSELPFIVITVEESGVTTLLDSGASVSYLRRSTFRHCHLQNMTKTQQTARTANGSGFNFLGSVDVEIRIAGYTLRHEFLVSEDEDCPAPALIGWDLLRKLSEKGIPITLNPHRKVIEIGSRELQLLSPGAEGYSKTNRQVDIINVKNIVIPPKTARRVQVTFVQEDLDDMLLLEAANDGVEVSRTMLHPRSSETAIRIKNVSDNHIQFTPGTSFGKASVVHPPGLKVFAPLDPYMPPEADWTDRLPNIPTNEKEFMENLNLTGCQFGVRHRQQLKELIGRNKSAFYNDDGNLGCFTGNMEHKIELVRDAQLPKPVRARLPINKAEEVNRQVQQLADQGVIEPSTSMVLSPVVLVPKKDKTMRFTVDYRRINTITKKENYIIPQITDIIDLASGCKFYSTFDLIMGFFQISLRKKDRYLTAFATTEGTWQFRRMPMGLCGSPHTFQTAMRIVQHNVKAKLFVYLDDLLLVSSTAEEHLKDLEEVFRVTERFGLKMRLEKCRFGCPEVTFLGLRVGKEGVSPNPTKIKAIVDFPAPTTVKAIQSFLGICNYFRRFVRNYSSIAAPLTDLTKADIEFIWTNDHQKAFEELKSQLVKAPILTGPIPGRPYIIESDASCIAVGAVLLQRRSDGDPLQAVAFASRKLNKHEKNYPPIETEALALVFAVAQFRTYILGMHTTIVVDHKPLTSLLTRKDLVGRLAKYQLVLAEYSLDILYRPGRLNVIGDALSRYTADEIKEAKPRGSSSIAAIAVDSHLVQEAQMKSEWCQKIIENMEKDVQGSNDDRGKRYYVVINDLLYQKPQNENDPPRLLIPDEDLAKKIVEEYHDSPLKTAHGGVDRTVDAIKKRFIWRNMKRDVQEYIGKCEKCQKRKTNPHQTTLEPLGQLPATSRPFDRVHVDILGPLPITELGNRYVLTMIDSFSKWIIATPMSNQSAEQVSRTLTENLITKFGPPQSITTDCGTQFGSRTFTEVMKTFRTRHNFTAPYHKASNGQVERAHRTLEEALSAYVNDHQSDWDTYIHLVTHALNSAKSETTGFSPFFVVFGRESRIPEDNELQTPSFNWTMSSTEQYTDLMKTQLSEAWKLVKDRTSKKTDVQRHRFEEQNRCDKRYVEIGDSVLVRRAPPQNKLAPHLHGPYDVVGVDDFNVEFRDDRGKKQRAHKNDVRVFKHDAARQNDKTVDPIEETAVQPEADQPASPTRRSDRQRRRPVRFT